MMRRSMLPALNDVAITSLKKSSTLSARAHREFWKTKKLSRKATDR